MKIDAINTHFSVELGEGEDLLHCFCLCECIFVYVVVTNTLTHIKGTLKSQGQY